MLSKPTNLGSKFRLRAFPFKTLRFVETIDLQFMQGEEVMRVDRGGSRGSIKEHNDVLGVNLRFEPYQVLAVGDEIGGYLSMVIAFSECCERK